MLHFLIFTKTHLRLFKDKKPLGCGLIIFSPIRLPVSGDRTLLTPLLRDTPPGRVALMRSLGKPQPSPGHSSSRGTPLSHVVGHIGKCHSAAASHGSLSEMWEFQVYSRTPQPESAFLQDPQVNLGTMKSGKHICPWWRAQVWCMKQVHQAGVPKLVHWDNPEGWAGEEGGRGIQDEGTHVHLWLIHVNIWQNPPQYCTVISPQLK